MKGPIELAARSKVFANLLMLALAAAGLAALRGMTREMFPEFALDKVTVSTLYPGATPDEVEQAVSVRVEEAVRGIDGVETLESVSTEGRSLVSLEVDRSARDPQDVMIDVQNEVGRITTFPADVEEPVVQLVVNRREVMSLVLSGRLDDGSLARLGRELEEELLRLPEVNEVTRSGLRPYQLSVRVREADLQRHGLTFERVSAAIRGESLNLPLGRLRTRDEELVLRVDREVARGRELAEVPVVTRPDGTRVLLRDVATVEDGFSEDELAVRLDGQPAVFLSVLRSADQDVIRLARKLREWLEERRATLPAGVELAVWQDNSTAVVDRLALLSTNGAQGLALVFVSLLLFLGTRLSFWVAAGLPVAFLAALAFLHLVGGTLNMISSFALIMVLGILVDDSIVVAENIARHARLRGGPSVDAAVAGVREVTWPVLASVTTTAIAFVPLALIEGTIGKFIRIMPVAVVVCLLASLIECLLILPAHLAHGRIGAPEQGRLARLRARLDRWIVHLVERRYGPTLDWALERRYQVLALGLGFVLLSAGLVASGRPRFVFFPTLDAETVRAQVTLPDGASFRETEAAARQLEAAAQALRQALPPAFDGRPVARRVLAQVGEGGAHKASVTLELARGNERDVRSEEVIRRWRELAGPLPLARSLVIEGTMGHPAGRPIELRIMAPTPAAGGEIAARVREALATYPGVTNVDDNLQPGKRELRLALRPGADALGLTTESLARQLFSGFSGAEAQTLQRGRDEVEVRVRYDPSERSSQAGLGDLRVRTAEGALVPLAWAAELERGRSLSQIERRDGRRLVKVMADVDDEVTNANQVVRSLEEGVLADVRARWPGTALVFGGAQEEQRETVLGIVIGFALACFGIYAILSLLFESYVQPAIIMAIIPVGFAGAIWGHALLGKPLTIFSVFGMVGLAGIVVNDALVLIDFYNRRRAQLADALLAARETGRIRFQAVFLTTLTTVAGLAPLLLETSLSAQFVIPMALSIASGVATATLLTLYAVPAACLVVEDVLGLWHGSPGTPEPEQRIGTANRE